MRWFGRLTAWDTRLIDEARQEAVEAGLQASVDLREAKRLLEEIILAVKADKKRNIRLLRSAIRAKDTFNSIALRLQKGKALGNPNNTLTLEQYSRITDYYKRLSTESEELIKGLKVIKLRISAVAPKEAGKTVLRAGENEIGAK